MTTNGNNSGMVVSTGAYLYRNQLTWKIENFGEIRRSENLISAQHILIDLGDAATISTQWKCYLFPMKEENAETSAKTVGIYLVLNKAADKCKDVTVSFQVRIKTNKYVGSLFSVVKNLVDMFPIGWGWKDFILAETVSDYILQNGCLFLELDLKLFATSETPTSLPAIEIENQHKIKFGEKLFQDLGKFRLEPVKSGNSETKVISKDGVEFSVVRGILSARSPFFEKMFQSEMEEANAGTVQISDLSSETVNVLLEFIYTGRLHKDWNSTSVLPELLYAAGKYQLPDLLAFMDEIVAKVCCMENVGFLIGHARKLGLKKAKSDLVEYFRKNMTGLDDIISVAKDCNVSNVG